MNSHKIQSDERKIQLSIAGRILTFQGMGESVIRAAVTEDGTYQGQSLMIREDVQSLTVPLEVRENDAGIWVINRRICACVDRGTGLCTWYRTAGRENADGGEICGEKLCGEWKKQLIPVDVFRCTTQGEAPVVKRVKTVDGERSFIENLKETKEREAFCALLGFTWDEDEAIYGLGQGEDGIYNYRHKKQYLYQHNMRIPMPFLVSGRQYGVLFDCCSLMTFDDETERGLMTLDTVEQLDYYVIAGGCIEDVIRGYRLLTGQASLLPRWAFGYIQSKEAYHSADELLSVGQEYRKRRIPLDGIVQDWKTWEEGKWGNKVLDKSRYGNIREVNEKLHGMHIHTMVSIWPNMGEQGENHREFMEKGMLLGDCSTYDAFDEEARELYWKQMGELYSGGFDSWWCDSTEPFSGPDWGGSERRAPKERYELVGGEHKKYLDASAANAFSLVHAKGIYENQRTCRADKRVLNLTRSGYASQQRYGTVLWSGDTAASWQTLKNQITEGLNMCISGMPYWTLDIGGFFTVGTSWQNRGCDCNTNPEPLWFWKGEYNRGVKDKGYCELYVRWLSYGVFLPVFRSHGTDTPREIWNFGEPGTVFYDAIEKNIRLRYSLMPYIYSLAGRVALDGYTMMRGLIFDFPADETVRTLSSEYMFGDSLLICPVTAPMYYEKENVRIDREKVWACYLPKGTGWYHYRSSRYYEGGQWVSVPAPLDEIPFFVKAGSIVPFVREETEYAEQALTYPLTFKIYPGADAVFDFYEDGGDDYTYEEGNYALTRMCWNDRDARLTAGKPAGSFSGGELKKGFQVEIISPCR